MAILFLRMVLKCTRRKMQDRLMDDKIIIIHLDNNNNSDITTMTGDPLRIGEEAGEARGDLEQSADGGVMLSRLKM